MSNATETREVSISELVDKANGYSYGMIGYGGSVSAHILFNEAREDDKTVTFQQVNQDDVNISVNKEEIESIKDKSADGMICYKVFMKSGAIISIVLLQKKDGEAQACHMLYGSYDDFVKELDLYELEEKVSKAKKAFVSISDNSTYLKNTYENIYLEDEIEEDGGTRRLILFNGDKDNPTDKIAFTLYDDAVNDIWLMYGAKAEGGADGWEGLKLRLYNQPFTEVRVSLLYVER